MSEQTHSNPDDHSVNDTPHVHNHEGLLRSALHLGSSGHHHATSGDYATNELGIRAVKLSLLLLGITTILQAIIVLGSGSVALLADTLHNLGDALNSIPLWIAFAVARRKANARYTYGYGRAEDLAGLVIVFSIAISAVVIFYEAFDRLLNPTSIDNLAWVAAAALIGFLGNEAVAQLQIRTGQRIESAALVADGRHARIDGLTSLAVLCAVAATLLGYPILDPIIGIGIGVIVLLIARDAAHAIWYRLMDAVDPELTHAVVHTIEAHEAVDAVVALRLRWIGHRLSVDAEIVLSAATTLAQFRQTADQLSDDLQRKNPAIDRVLIEPRLRPV